MYTRLIIICLLILLSSAIWGDAQGRMGIGLEDGWNLLSINVIPADACIDSVLSEMVYSGNLIQVKDEYNSFLPQEAAPLNTLESIQPGAGYAIRCSTAEDLIVSGEPAEPQLFPITLNIGWNLVGFLPQQSMAVEDAFEALIDNGVLERVQSETESFDPEILPVFNTLSILEPGKAYWVQVNSDVVFTYSTAARNGDYQRSRELFPRPWETVFYPSSTIAYCYVTISGEPAAAGDEVGAFIDGECRGVGTVFIMGDNATTFFSIQSETVELISFNVWDESRDEVLEVAYTTMTNPGGDIGYPPDQLPIDAIGTGVETWQPVIKKHSTTVLGRAAINNEPAGNGDIIAAFVNGECRGKQQVVLFDGVAFVTLLIHGETEEAVNFKLWDSSEDSIYDLDLSITSDPSEVLFYPPDYAPFIYGEVVFNVDMPQEITFISGQSASLDITEYIDYLFWDELDISISGNENITVSIVDNIWEFTCTQGYNGSEQIMVTVENIYNGDTISDEITIMVTPTGEPDVITISDVANDEGGWIEIIFSPSWYDEGEAPLEEQYIIYVQQDSLWQEIAQLPATGAEQYNMQIATTNDSTAADPALFSYLVEAVMLEGVWQSEAAYGYSIDNLAPAAPYNLSFTNGNLVWEESLEADFAYYLIYLNGEYWQTADNALIAMLGITGEIQIAAVDIHDNISPFSISLFGGYGYGDVDHDMQITSYDASLVLQYFCLLQTGSIPSPWEEWRQQIADVDNSDAIEAFDAALILRYTVGMIDELPVILNRDNQFKRSIIKE